jgi:hypothetical protein
MIPDVWFEVFFAACSPTLLKGLREGSVALEPSTLALLMRRFLPDGVTVESIEVEPPARVVIHATARRVVGLRLALPLDLKALRWSQAEATVTYALASEAAEIEGDGLVSSFVLAIGLAIARLRGAEEATLVDDRLALALHAEAVPEGRRVDLRNFPAVAAELDRAILGVAIWSMITFDRVECTDTALVVRPSSQTLARVALWRAHAESAAEAGRKAASTAQMLLGHGLNALRNFKRKDG